MKRERGRDRRGEGQEERREKRGREMETGGGKEGETGKEQVNRGREIDRGRAEGEDKSGREKEYKTCRSADAFIQHDLHCSECLHFGTYGPRRKRTQSLRVVSSAVLYRLSHRGLPKGKGGEREERDRKSLKRARQPPDLSPTIPLGLAQSRHHRGAVHEEGVVRPEGGALPSAPRTARLKLSEQRGSGTALSKILARRRSRTATLSWLTRSFNGPCGVDIVHGMAQRAAIRGRTLQPEKNPVSGGNPGLGLCPALCRAAAPQMRG